MIRHVVLFRFKPEIGAAETAAVLAELAALPQHYPAMRRFGLGENVSERDRAFTHVMTLEFERREQLDRYLRGADHERFVAERFLPSVDDRAIATYETDG